MPCLCVFTRRPVSLSELPFDCVIIFVFHLAINSLWIGTDGYGRPSMLMLYEVYVCMTPGVVCRLAESTIPARPLALLEAVRLR